jgi:hypothetical protein
MTRTDILNLLAVKRSYRRYLEIGVSNPTLNFSQILISEKIGVDPSPGGTHLMTSDEFFDQDDVGEFDLIFVDGLHHANQVIRDAENSLKHLSPGGAIVMHDCNPEAEELQHLFPVVGNWTGDVWKAFGHFRRTRSDLQMLTVDTDFGVGIIQRGEQELFPIEGDFDWQFLCQNRTKLLNLKSVEEFLQWVDQG